MRSPSLKVSSARRSAEETLIAYAKRAALAQQAVSCLADYFFEEGLARAKELDVYYEQQGKLVGPLHGLPISVKVGTTILKLF